jgi:hypothetical protein
LLLTKDAENTDIAAGLFFNEAILLIRRSFLIVIKRTVGFWSLLRRTQIILFPLFLKGVTLMTFQESTHLIGPGTLMIAVRTWLLGMLASSTFAYGFAVAFARVESGCS